MTTRVWFLYVLNYVAMPHQTTAIPKRYEIKLKILAQIRTLPLGQGTKTKLQLQDKNPVSLSRTLNQPVVSKALYQTELVHSLRLAVQPLSGKPALPQTLRLCSLYARGDQGSLCLIHSR